MLLWYVWCCSYPSDVVLICLMLFWSVWSCYEMSFVVLIPQMLFCILILLMLFWSVWSFWCCSDPYAVVLIPLMLFRSHCSAPSDVVLITLLQCESIFCGLWSLFIRADHSVIVPPRASPKLLIFIRTVLILFFCVRTPKSTLFTKPTTSGKTTRLFIISVFRKVFCQYTKKLKCLLLDFFHIVILQYMFSRPLLTHVYWQNLYLLVGSQLGHKTPKYLLYSCIYRKVKLLRRTLGKKYCT